MICFITRDVTTEEDVSILLNVFQVQIKIWWQFKLSGPFWCRVMIVLHHNLVIVESVVKPVSPNQSSCLLFSNVEM